MVINSTTLKYLCAITLTSAACIGVYKYTQVKAEEFKKHKEEVLDKRHLYFDDFAVIEDLSKHEDITADSITRASDILTERRADVFGATTIEKFDKALKVHDEFEHLLKTFTSALNISALIEQEYRVIQQKREEEQERIEAMKKAQARKEAMSAREQELNMAIRTAKKIGDYISVNREEKNDEEDC